MTPAEELTAAADKLDALVAEAAPDWQLSESNHLALPLIEMPYMNGMLKGQPGYTLSGPNDATTFYIAAMNPLVGKALADLLRAHAEVAATLEQMLPPNENEPTGHIWNLAKLINGSDR